jgi:hypothetical protein
MGQGFDGGFHDEPHEGLMGSQMENGVSYQPVDPDYYAQASAAGIVFTQYYYSNRSNGVLLQIGINNRPNFSNSFKFAQKIKLVENGVSSEFWDGDVRSPDSFQYYYTDQEEYWLLTHPVDDTYPFFGMGVRGGFVDEPHEGLTGTALINGDSMQLELFIIEQTPGGNQYVTFIASYGYKFVNGQVVAIPLTGHKVN